MATPRWEHFEHGADIGVRGHGTDAADAFAAAAEAMMAVIVAPERVAAKECVTISCAAPDDELLLVDWLNALIYEMATRGMLFRRFEVRIENGRLEAEAWGEAVEIERHRPAVEVKGATFTALHVGRSPDANGWIAECVVDV